MKTFASAGRVLATVALMGAASLAQAQGLTREQVKAELAEAIRTGDFVVGEQGMKAYEQWPGMYPARPVAIGKTRDEVKIELAEAIRNGDMIEGEQGRTAYEMAPHRYPARPVVAGKTRDQVQAELAEAIRLGDAPLHGEDGLSPAERHPQRFAAVRAAHALAMKAQQGEQSALRTGEGPIVR